MNLPPEELPDGMLQLYLHTALEYQRTYREEPPPDDPLTAWMHEQNDAEVTALLAEYARRKDKP